MASIGSAGATATTYTDGTTQPSTTYYYAVAAFDTFGLYGPNSSSVSVKTPQEPPPTAPSGLSAHAIAYNQVSLSWTAATSVIGLGGYTIYRGTSPSSLASIGSAGATATAYTDGTAQPSATYYYAVAAYDTLGLYGPSSSSVSVTTPQEPAPTAPSGLSAQAIAYYQVNLSWTASTSVIGLGLYTVYRGTSPSSLASIGSAAANATTYTDGSVQPSTTYYYAVAAYDTLGLYGPFSSSVSVTTPQEPAPTAPSGPSAQAIAYNQVNLSWTAATSSSGLGGYTVYRGSSPTSLASIGTAPATATTYTDGSAEPSTTYYYDVAAFDIYGLYGPSSSTVSATTPAEPPPAVVSVTPNPASGLSNTFALTYSDVAGASDLKLVEVVFNSAVDAPNSCFVEYAPAANLLYLLNNAGTGSSSITPGSGTLSNSQCTITGNGTSVVKSGNNLPLNLDVTASSTFTGKHSLFMFAEDSSEMSSWVNEGTWTPAANQPPALVSVSPNPASGLSETFALTYSDPNGASDLGVVEVDFGPAASPSNSCFVLYYPATNSLELLTNAGAVSSKITPGSGTLSNSQCTITGSGTTVVRSGDDLTLNLAVTASSTYTGKQKIFMFAEDNSSASTGYVDEGTWTPAANEPPAVVSVTPNPATGLSNTFALVYSDPNGASDLDVVEVDFGSAVNGSNSCFVLYYPATNSLELLTNTGTVSSKITPGSGTLSNSQCTISGSGTTVVRSGDSLTLNLAVTASSTYTSGQNVYMFAEDDSSAQTGWVQKGTWTP